MWFTVHVCVCVFMIRCEILWNFESQCTYCIYVCILFKCVCVLVCDCVCACVLCCVCVCELFGIQVYSIQGASDCETTVKE